MAGAVRDAERSVAFADRSGDAFQRMVKRTTLGDALHQAGRREEALERFREAEAMQAERQPEYPLLYSLQGFRYCDLLLAGAERAAGGGPEDRGAGEACDEVERRAAEALWSGTVRNASSLLDIALDHLTLGRARLYRAILGGAAPDAAGPEIDQAVDGLRRAGQSDELPHGPPHPRLAPLRPGRPGRRPRRPRRGPGDRRARPDAPLTSPTSTSTAPASSTTAPPSPTPGG